MVGVSDLNTLYFNKDRIEDSVVTLDFLAEQSSISIRVKFLGATNNVQVEVSQDGEALCDLEEKASLRVLALLFKVSAEFVLPQQRSARQSQNYSGALFKARSAKASIPKRSAISSIGPRKESAQRCSNVSWIE
jgi:hypothetical protein